MHLAIVWRLESYIHECVMCIVYIIQSNSVCTKINTILIDLSRRVSRHAHTTHDPMTNNRIYDIPCVFQRVSLTYPQKCRRKSNSKQRNALLETKNCSNFSSEKKVDNEMASIPVSLYDQWHQSSFQHSRYQLLSILTFSSSIDKSRQNDTNSWIFRCDTKRKKKLSMITNLYTHIAGTNTVIAMFCQKNKLISKITSFH